MGKWYKLFLVWKTTIGRLEFFNDFKVYIANIEANRTLISQHRDFLWTSTGSQQQGPYTNHNGSENVAKQGLMSRAMPGSARAMNLCTFPS